MGLSRRVFALQLAALAVAGAAADNKRELQAACTCQQYLDGASSSYQGSMCYKSQGGNTVCKPNYYICSSDYATCTQSAPSATPVASPATSTAAAPATSTVTSPPSPAPPPPHPGTCVDKSTHKCARKLQRSSYRFYEKCSSDATFFEKCKLTCGCTTTAVATTLITLSCTDRKPNKCTPSKLAKKCNSNAAFTE
eukprot:7094013-Prymnesium_polylepis.1